MNELTVLNNESLTMSSLEIAKLTDKEHFHVLRDIERILEEVGIRASIFLGSYLSKQKIRSYLAIIYLKENVI